VCGEKLVAGPRLAPQRGERPWRLPFEEGGVRPAGASVRDNSDGGLRPKTGEKARFQGFWGKA